MTAYFSRLAAVCLLSCVVVAASSPACDDGKQSQVKFLLEWGKLGKEPGEFHFPIGIAINASDEVFVTDFYNSRVQKFSVDGRLLAVIPVLPNPGGMAIG